MKIKNVLLITACALSGSLFAPPPTSPADAAQQPEHRLINIIRALITPGSTYFEETLTELATLLPQQESPRLSLRMGGAMLSRTASGGADAPPEMPELSEEAITCAAELIIAIRQNLHMVMLEGKTVREALSQEFPQIIQVLEDA
jgi:hypothetical protein